MNLYLDTSTSTAILRLSASASPVELSASSPSADIKEFRADLGREMAEKLLSFLEENLKANQLTWTDLSSLTFFSGPGSFTGLRIGAAVINALAHELHLPLFDHHGNKRDLIIPDYGRPANITV